MASAPCSAPRSPPRVHPDRPEPTGGRHRDDCPGRARTAIPARRRRSRWLLFPYFQYYRNTNHPSSPDDGQPPPRGGILGSNAAPSGRRRPRGADPSPGGGGPRRDRRLLRGADPDPDRESPGRELPGMRRPARQPARRRRFRGGLRRSAGGGLSTRFRRLAPAERHRAAAESARGRRPPAPSERTPRRCPAGLRLDHRPVLGRGSGRGCLGPRRERHEGRRRGGVLRGGGPPAGGARLAGTWRSREPRTRRPGDRPASRGWRSPDRSPATPTP